MTGVAERMKADLVLQMKISVTVRTRTCQNVLLPPPPTPNVKEVWGKVMFLQLSVHRGGGGIMMSLPVMDPPPPQHHHFPGQHYPHSLTQPPAPPPDSTSL